MKKILTLFLFILGFLLVPSAHAQFTTVTGQVINSSGQIYINCTMVVIFVPSPTATMAPTVGNGQTFPTTIPLANCDGNGRFSVAGLADNNLVVDGHAPGQISSQWQFRICTGAGYVPQVCFTWTGVITGQTMDITSELTAVAPAIIPPTGGGGGNNADFVLTTNGTNGVATYTGIGGTLNIPNYSLFVSTNNTSGAASFTIGTNGSTLNIPNYNVINSVTNTGQGGPPSLAGGILNIPQYQAPITVTSSGAGHASFAGSTLNIPANQVILTVNGTTGASTFDPVTNILNIPNYATGTGGGGVPSGSYPGQLLVVGAGNTLAAANPGLAEAASSPIAGTGTVTPNCSSTTSIGDLGQNFVLQPGAVVNIPAAACVSAVFYFFAQGAATFNAPAGQTLNIYNGATYTTGTTYAATMGQYVTLVKSKTTNTWLMAVGNATTATSQFVSSITTIGSGGPSTVVNGVLNVPDYSTAPEPPPGIQIPAGALPGQVLGIDSTGANVIAGSPGLSDSSGSPVTTNVYAPSCGTSDTGDRSRMTVVQVATTITIPPTTNVLCKNAVFYFLMQAAATFNRSGTDTFDVYNGATALTAQTTYTAAVGAYLTMVNGNGSNWHIMVESGPGTGGGGTPVQWQQNGTLLGTPTTINCTTNVTCAFAANTVTMSAQGGTGPANGALKPAATAGIIYLDNVNGNDANDGLSWGSAKATLVNSYASLPANGGTIYMAKNWGNCLVPPAGGVNMTVLHKTVVLQGAGAYSTCITYNGGTGAAITLDTGESSSIRDLYIQATVNTGYYGIIVSSNNGCNKCSFMHVNVVGFQEPVYLANGAYGTLWDHDQIGSCLADQTGAAFGTIAFRLFGSNTDDTRVTNSEFLGCNTLFSEESGSGATAWVNNTVFQNATNGTVANSTATWINIPDVDRFECNGCHWYNQAAGAATNWVQAASGAKVVIQQSSFDSLRNGAAIVAPIVINSMTDPTTLLILTNNIINHTGTEVAQEFAEALGTPGPKIPTWGINNIIENTTTIPKLYNVTPQ